MILIADSGSTKTDWAVVDNGRQVVAMSTQGINPFHQDAENIATVIEEELLPKMGNIEPEGIFFYGSGCREDKVEMMCGILGKAFPQCARIEAQGDLLAAARAVCGEHEGIACIMGTGANSCLYDGNRVVENTPPLGYILGDEGSGAVLGKLFVNALFKGQLPSELKDEWLEETGLSLNIIINKVYREPLANRFLASTSRFIHQHLSVEPLERMVVYNFREHFRRNVNQYGRKDLTVGAIGSVAYYYREQLQKAATVEGYTLGKVMRSPMDGLVRYHS
ncbi:MAG: ATPase [Prevotellaceae bacterium]|nr:ATPase [Prevotellaceae bacterium]